MNVLHLTLSLEPGGRREAIRTLVARHKLDGVHSLVATLKRLGCEPELVQDEFAGHLELARRNVADAAAVKRLIQFCRQHQVHVIHAHDAASQLYAAAVRIARPATRVLMTFHRSLGFETARRRDRLRNALASLACHAIVVGSAERRRHYLAENVVRPSKVIRIPFGIDTKRFFPDPEARVELRRQFGWVDSTLVFGAAGHFGKEKGIDLVVRAFQQLVHQSPDLDTRLLVVGDGSAADRERIERLVRETPRSGRIHLAGFRRDIPRWFNAMDVFIHAPRQEAFGLVVAEAMATGLPVVAGDTGGVPDMIRDQKTGLLVPAEQPQQLAEALAQMADAPDLRRRLAQKARQVALAEYPAELYAARYLALYRHLAAGRRVQCFDPFALNFETPTGTSSGIQDSTTSSHTADPPLRRTESCLH